jgi:hypothetical protein
LPLRLSLLAAVGTPVPLATIRARGAESSAEELFTEAEEGAEAALLSHDIARQAYLRDCEAAARQAFAAVGS